MGDRKGYQRGKIGKHSLDHITEIKNLKKLQTVRLSRKVENLTTIVNHKHLTTHAADHHPGEHEKEVVTYEDEILQDISETKVDTETDNTNLQN